jgi:predicted GIY-YIG superfamily endonuclease
MPHYSVYVLSNFSRTVFYTSVTNNLQSRMRQHRNNEGGDLPVNTNAIT